MTKQSWILLGVIVVLVAGFIIYSSTRPSPEQDTASNGAPAVTVTTTSSSQGTVTVTTAPAPVPAPAPAGNPTRQIAATIFITAPVAGTQWIINQPHAISWSKDPNSTGQAYLVDAHTGQTAGWLSSN